MVDLNDIITILTLIQASMIFIAIGCQQLCCDQMHFQTK